MNELTTKFASQCKLNKFSNLWKLQKDSYTELTDKATEATFSRKFNSYDQNASEWKLGQQHKISYNVAWYTPWLSNSSMPPKTNMFASTEWQDLMMSDSAVKNAAIASLSLISYILI